MAYWPIPVYLEILFGSYIVFTLLSNKYGTGLTRFPGPFAAGFTNFWRIRHSYVFGNKRPTFVQLHERYGDVVRVGPRSLSFADPRAIADIYGPKSNMPKSKWYIAFEAHGKGPKKENMLVAPAFKVDHLKPKEEVIDGLVHTLLRNLDDVAKQTNRTGKPVDLPLNLQFFTFDAGGVMGFSKPYGFLRDRIDLDGIIQSVRVGSTHLNRLAQAPVLQWWIDKNPLAVYFGFVAPPMAFAKKYLPLPRIEKQIAAPAATADNHDILDQYMLAARKQPGVVTRDEVVDLGLMVVVPASEAVRTAIAVCIYQAIKHPAVLSKLRAELDAALPPIADNTVAIPSYVQLLTLPYLTACINETFRIHPPTGFMKERIVPAGGAIIAGHHVPAGTTVGCLDWVIHRDKSIFGEDSGDFRPERWLGASHARREEMEKLLCPFGFESRLCLGREIALLEVFKVLAVLVRTFEIELADQQRDMDITWGNIVSVDFGVRMKRRK